MADADAPAERRRLQMAAQIFKLSLGAPAHDPPVKNLTGAAARFRDRKRLEKAAKAAKAEES